MTRSFRFIHLADAHLDTNYYSDKPEVRKLLQQEARRSLEEAVELAIEKKAHAVLIAGDLFDRDLFSFATEKILLKALQRLDANKIKVLYAPGNHDPLSRARGVNRLTWPGNVHIFSSDSPAHVRLDDGNGNYLAAFTGMGHESRQEERNLAAQFPPAQSSYPQIAILHALVTGHKGSENHLRYAPCNLADLRGKGYDYWALGHIHTFSQVSEDPPAYYPGNIQGRNPGETGQKGCIMVEFQGKELIKAEFVPLSRLQWTNINIHLDELEQVATLDQLQHLLLNRLKKEVSLLPEETALLPRINLSGATALFQELKSKDNVLYLQESLSEQMSFPWLEIKTGRVYPPLPVDDYRQGPHLLAWALDLLASAQEDEELLLSLAPRVIAGVETGFVGSSRNEKADYLRSLLKGLDKEMAMRMVDKKSD